MNAPDNGGITRAHNPTAYGTWSPFYRKEESIQIPGWWFSITGPRVYVSFCGGGCLR